MPTPLLLPTFEEIEQRNQAALAIQDWWITFLCLRKNNPRCRASESW